MKVLKTKKKREARASFTLRIDSDLRGRLMKVADQQKVSLNELIVKILDSALESKDFIVRL